jgi:multidrug efflux pump subunit AcrA (membrane-fusion protein)
MTRRLGLASLFLIVFAFGGAAAAPSRPIQARVSVVWLSAQEQAEHETRPVTARVAPSAAIALSQPPPSAGFRPAPLEGWLFERPPPAAL